MIMIDVFFPPLEEVYDFEVTETMLPEELLSGVLALIYEKEHVTLPVELRELFFYRSGDFLKQNIPLKEQGVGDGDRLILL